MKRFILSLSLSILFLNGCSEEKTTETMIQENGLESKKETLDVEKTVEAVIENKIDTDEGPDIKIEPELEEELIIDSLSPKCFSMNDSTLLNGSVGFGCLDKIPAHTWNDISGESISPVVFFSEKDNSVYAFAPIYENPYEMYYSSGKILKEERAFFTNYYLLERSLLNSGFVEKYINPNQTLPEELDSNSMVGIEISEAMLNDIKGWYTTLDKAMEQKVPNKEWFMLSGEIAEQAQTEYPEIRQIPFPTYEIGYNISSTIFSFQELLFESDGMLGDEVERLRIENLVLGKRNSIEIMDKQLEEIKATYQ